MDKAIAILHSTTGDCHGSVIFESVQRNKTKVSFDLTHFQPFQIHAIHIHEFGDLSNGCTTLGGHYNPTNQKHGNHVGDLIYNFTTNKKGEFNYVYINNLNISHLYGRSIVIHQHEDDLGQPMYDDLSFDELRFLCKKLGYKVRGKRDMIKELTRQSYLTGNAGGRIACGIIGRSNL